MVLNTIVDIICTKAKGVGKKINRVNTMTTIETISWSTIKILKNKFVKQKEFLLSSSLIISFLSR